MNRQFDLIVIGTGTAATTPAFECRRAGWSVAVIDPLPFGGTCVLRGCDPKKVLVGAAEVIDRAKRMKTKGINSENLNIGWQQLMQFKRTFTDPVPAAREESFRNAGIAAFHAAAHFTGKQTIEAGDDRLEGRFILIATGAWPARLNIPGEEFLTRSDQFLSLENLPRRIVFIGGGYISFELAHVAARAGAEVTILHRGLRPLKGFDPDLAGQLLERTRKLGIAVHLNAAAEGIGKSGDGLGVSASSAGGQFQIPADMVVHGAGRAPSIAGLDLPAGGVEAGKKGVSVNEFLQSLSNPAVYAAGDAAASGGFPLTPIAGYEGRVVAENMLHGNRLRAAYNAIPTVVFTLPPLASVGLSERAARGKGLQFRVNHEKTAGWYSSHRTGEECSGYKVLIEEGSERILGAHLLGEQAEETINLFALAMRAGVTASKLKQSVFSYPTHASDVQYML
jgi:glutathione reductase (NADPH)